MDISSVPAQEHRGQSKSNSDSQAAEGAQPFSVPSAAFACPYCEDGIYTADEALWEHVQNRHLQQLQGLGLQNRGGIALYRKLLREEALHKWKSLVSRGKIPNKEISHTFQDRNSSPIADIDRLSIQTRHRDSLSGPQTRRSAGKQSMGRLGAEPIIRSEDPDSAYPPDFPLGGSPEALESASTRDRIGMGVTSHQSPKYGLSSPPPLKAGNKLGVELPPRPGFGSTDPQSTLSPTQVVPGPDSPGMPEVTPDTRWPGLVLQPDSRPITQEQLAAEVKSIYAGLTMVENKCIHVDKAQASAVPDPETGSHAKLANDHWQALIALHRTLLHEHHDFLLASQHPSASPALRRLAAKYSMPARMWKHGIHSFLELLRRRLPESLDYMLAFIYIAYQMVALLYETVPAFEDTWIECLGDLGRYRMAIEDEDLRDRETWAGVARFWYSKAADKSPHVGRLYHHLAILARPNALQQMYFYCRSLTCVQAFLSARESILTLLDPILGRTHATYFPPVPIDANFIKAHGILFVNETTEKFDAPADEFLGQLDTHIGRVTARWKEQGVYIAVTNIASLFGFGTEDSTLRQMFEFQIRSAAPGPPSRPQNSEVDAHGPLPPSTPPTDTFGDTIPPLDLVADFKHTFRNACRLTFTTFHLVLRRIGDKNVLPHIHIILSFLFSVTKLPYDTSSLMDEVPWDDLAIHLNTLAKADRTLASIEPLQFPHLDDKDRRPLPEDYLIQGQIWSQPYFPSSWFDVSIDEEERSLELASTGKSRAERIHWLGRGLAARTNRLHYDSDKKRWSVPSAENTSSHSQSSGSDVEVYTQKTKEDSLFSRHSTAEPMEDVTHEAIRDERPETPRPRDSKTKTNILIRNYTIVVCEKSIILQQSEIFVDLLESGDWKVVIPENVVMDLWTLSKGAGNLEGPAQTALNIIRSAIKAQKNVQLVDTKGKDIREQDVALEQLGEVNMDIDNNAEEIAIGITRKQSELQEAENNPGVAGKPAVLLSEDRAMRHRARLAGVASVAASKIKKFISPHQGLDPTIGRRSPLRIRSRSRTPEPPGTGRRSP